MSFDLKALTSAVQQHGRVVRVVVAGIKGSVPREVGASMLVWEDGQSGTIGGGALELDASNRARKALEEKHSDWVVNIPLGPGLGQCCGGAVTLLSEFYDASGVSSLSDKLVLRQVSGAAEIPLKINRQLSDARNSGIPIKPQLVDGWMLEPISAPSRQLWIYGAGHVGRALVSVLEPLPDTEITWLDSDVDRYPDQISSDINQLVAGNPAELVKFAPPDAEHLVLTYSHALDLEICHRLLSHGFKSAGLIGSKTKWARFRTRLRSLGHTDARIDCIDCPIGQTALGKHPQAIAVGVAAEFLSTVKISENLHSRVG